MDDAEWYRHQCEVRQCLGWPREHLQAYLREVARLRGAAAAARLLEDVEAQRAAGNDGTAGVWLDVELS